MLQEKYMNLKLGERGAIISIIAYLCLSSLKLFVGFSTGSQALKADGLNNTTDIVASLAVLIGLRLSQRPADSDHPYGHWKSETIASMLASFIMMAVGLQVLFDGVFSIFQGNEQSPDIIAAWTGLFCAVVMYFVYRYNKSLAEKTKSLSVMAAAKDNFSDTWVSVGTSVGIFGSQFNLPWLDTLTAVLVGYLICKTAWDIFRESSYNLSDGFDAKKIKDYQKTILSINGVEGVRNIKARNYGNHAVVDLVIIVDPYSAIKDAHDISTQVEKRLIKEHRIYEANVHVEPGTTVTR
ncbi:cation transporter [Sporolactobacillus sp. THM7-4]|nr:cation transporter [Sporolactobacillus sp. THM7-4]